RRSLLFLALMLASMFRVAIAQQDACRALEIPVGVINFEGQSFRGLAPQDFLAKAQKGSVAIKSIAYDDGPRRILLIVDTSRKLSPNLHKAEVELVKTFAAAARPEDTLGLLTAHGPGGIVKFGDPRSSLVDAISQESNTKEGKDRGVLDAVVQGLEWFSPS